MKRGWLHSQKLARVLLRKLQELMVFRVFPGLESETEMIEEIHGARC